MTTKVTHKLSAAVPAAPEVEATEAPAKTPASVRVIQGLVLVAVLALLGLVAFQMTRTGPLKAGQVGNGQPAPDFKLTTFDGEEFTLSELTGQGQVVVVNFWASWCKPCEEEAPHLENAWRHYRAQGVIFLGVDYVDTETSARRYIERFDITYPNGPDLGTQISHDYRVQGVPETFIVDQQGIVRKLFVGPVTQADLARAIEPLLNE